MKASTEKQIIQQHEAGRSFDFIAQCAFNADGNLTRDDVAKVIQKHRWKSFKKNGRK